MAGLTGGDGFFFLDTGRDVGRHGLIELRRQGTLHAALQFCGFGWELLTVGRKLGLPARLQRCTVGFGIPGSVYIRRHLKGRIRPIDRGARRSDLGITQRRAVNFVAALHVWRALADDGLAADQGGAIGFFCRGYGCVNGIDIVTIDIGDHVPAIGIKTLRGIVTEPAIYFAVNGNTVIVIERDEFGQPQCASQRASLMTDAFHQAAVAQKHIGVMVNDRVPGLIKFSRQQRLCQGHANCIGDALTQRTGGRLDTGRDIDFRMTRGFRMQLPEIFNFVHRQRIARQMQERIQQHGAMPVGDHKAVTIDPFGISRIVAQVPCPKRHSDLCHAHRHTGMAGICLLYGVHCQRTDCVGHFAARES